MTSCITGAASLVKPEPDVVGVYKVHGPLGNRYLVEMPAYTHLKPTYTVYAHTLTYHSLRSSRRSIHNGCQKKKFRKVVSATSERNAPKNRAKRAKKTPENAVERILWKNCI
jgi:hypothetical protein